MKSNIQCTYPPTWFRVTWIALLLLFIAMIYGSNAKAEEIIIIGDNLVLQAEALEIQEGPNGMIVFLASESAPEDENDSDNDLPDGWPDEPQCGFSPRDPRCEE